MSNRLPCVFTLLFCGLFLVPNVNAQINLSGTSYSQNFDNIANGLPAGFFIKINSTSTSLGTDANLTAAATQWNVTGSGFKNYASAEGLTASADATAQNNSSNRAIAMRQSGTAGTGGDPGAALVFQLANANGFQIFNLNFKIQSLDSTSPRTSTWTVDYAIGANPTNFTTIATNPAPLAIGNNKFSNTAVSVNFGNLLDNQPQNIWIRIVTLNASTGSGNRATTAFDDIQLTYQGSTDNTPPTISSLLPLHNATSHQAVIPLEINFSEPILKGSGNISVNNITDGGTVLIDVNNAAVSISGNKATINTSLIAGKQYSVTMPSAVFKDYANNAFAGITSSNWVFTAIAGYNYNFNNCTVFGAPGSGWTTFSFLGDSVWQCTSFGNNNSNAVQMNGFATGQGNLDNDDWLISPILNLTNFTFPTLSFQARTRFAGPAIQLFVSTNYSGTGSPFNAFWVPLNASLLVTGSDVWTLVDNISLNDYKTANTYIAFRYLSGPAVGASRWIIDDVNVRVSATAPAPSLTIKPVFANFDYTASGSLSRSKTVEFLASNLTSNLTITAPVSFQVSKDNSNFGNTAVYTQTEVNGGFKNVFVRYTPTSNNITQAGKLNFTSTGLTVSKADVAGNSIPYSSTLEIVNWNLNWFGSSGFGPTDKNLQQTNIKKIMDSLQADIYALSEIVDTIRLMNLTNSMPGYSFKVSDFCSGADNASSPNYAGGQKLAFIYKNDIVKNVKVRGMLRNGSGSATYTNWASGRYPFLMEADISNGQATKKYHFILIHGKAGSADINDYNRRKGGAKELKDSLDAQFSTVNIILLGDYNDDLDSTISLNVVPALTSYDDIVKDSTDNDHYKSITMPLSMAGLRSIAAYSDVIDHQIFSNEMVPDYVPFSARMIHEVENWVSNYSSRTTDHYPVMSRTLLPTAVTGINNITAAKLSFKLMPNPAKNQLFLSFKPEAGMVQIDILDINGQVVLRDAGYRTAAINQSKQLNIENLSSGIYLIRILNNQHSLSQIFVIQ